MDFLKCLTRPPAIEGATAWVTYPLRSKSIGNNSPNSDVYLTNHSDVLFDPALRYASGDQTAISTFFSWDSSNKPSPPEAFDKRLLAAVLLDKVYRATITISALVDVPFAIYVAILNSSLKEAVPNYDLSSTSNDDFNAWYSQLVASANHIWWTYAKVVTPQSNGSPITLPLAHSASFSYTGTVKGIYIFGNYVGPSDFDSYNNWGQISVTVQTLPF